MATEFTIENPIFLEENLISGVSLDMVVSAVKAGEEHGLMKVAVYIGFYGENWLETMFIVQKMKNFLYPMSLV